MEKHYQDMTPQLFHRIWKNQLIHSKTEAVLLERKKGVSKGEDFLSFFVPKKSTQFLNKRLLLKACVKAPISEHWPLELFCNYCNTNTTVTSSCYVLLDHCQNVNLVILYLLPMLYNTQSSLKINHFSIYLLLWRVNITCVPKLMCLSTKAGVFNLAKGHKSMAPYSSYT